MSRSARVTLLFGDGQHEFRLAIGQLEELQEKCDAGPEEIYARLGGARWRLQDVRETLRLGLIGGGMEPAKAVVLVNRYAGDGQIFPWKETCRTILLDALVGGADEALGEPKAGETENPDSLAES